MNEKVRNNQTEETEVVVDELLEKFIKLTGKTKED